nr:dihydrodipicolinate synthase family protein [Pseudomonas luteola]
MQATIEILAPLVTPLAGDNVCKASVKRQIELIKDSVTGYVPCLTSGEGWRLSKSQWLEMAKTTIEFSERKKVIVGIERPTTSEVLEYASLAEELGAESIMFTTPFGEEVTQNEMIEHFQKVHDKVRLNIYIYNETSLSKNNADLQTLTEIAKLERVLGIKDSPPSIRDKNDINILRESGLRYFVGWEHRLDADKNVDGNIVSLSNLKPEISLLATQLPPGMLKNEIQRLSEFYSLEDEQWFRYIKAHLNNFGVLSTNQLAKVEDRV